MTVDTNTLTTVARAAKQMSLTEPGLRDKIRRREVPAVRIAGHIYIDRETVARLAEQYPLIAP